MTDKRSLGEQWPKQEGFGVSSSESQEPEEGDYISYDSGHTWYMFGQPGEDAVVVIAEGKTTESVLRAYAYLIEWWPNAWLISDHGNAHLFKYNI